MQIVAHASGLTGGAASTSATAQALQIIKRRLDSVGLSASVATNGAAVLLTVSAADRRAAEELVTDIGLLRFRQVLGIAPGSVPGQQSDGGSSAGDQPVPGSASTNVQQVQQLFQTYDCSHDRAPTGGLDQPNEYIVACDQEGAIKYLLAPAAVEGSQIASADAATNTATDQWLVDVNFNGSGNSNWFDLTKKAFEADPQQSPATCQNLDIQEGCNEIAIALDGVVQSAPSSAEDGISVGQTQITGQFTEQQAKALAGVLKFGALPVRFDIQTVTTS